MFDRIGDERNPGGPPRGGGEPSDEQPPPSPDGLPEFDWAAFEEQFRAHAESAPERRESVLG